MMVVTDVKVTSMATTSALAHSVSDLGDGLEADFAVRMREREQ